MRLAPLARYLQAKPGPSQTTRWTAQTTRRRLSATEQTILDDAARKARALIERERVGRSSTAPAAGVSTHPSRQGNRPTKRPA